MGERISELESQVEALKVVNGYLIDALKWHLRGATGTDQRSLDHAMQHFESAFMKPESRP